MIFLSRGVRAEFMMSMAFAERIFRSRSSAMVSSVAMMSPYVSGLPSLSMSMVSESETSFEYRR